MPGPTQGATVAPGLTPSVRVATEEGSAEGPAPSVRLLPGEAVEGEWIVGFKGQGPQALPGGAIQGALGLGNAYVVRQAGQGYRLTAAQASEAAGAWEELPQVEYVEPNYRYAIAQAPPWGQDPGAAQAWGILAVGAPRLWPLTQGEGGLVAVLDTGVDPHPDLAGALAPGVDLVEGGEGWRDPHGHGTHVAGIIAARAGNGLGVAGVAPGAMLLPVRVLDAEGKGTNATIAKGIQEAVQRGAKVINLSLGGAEASETLRRAIVAAQSAGVVVVAASGNEGVTTAFYPAAFEGVIAVGAHDLNRQRAAFSNHGSYLRLSAPGVAIGSLAPGGGLRTLSGTSMAAPHVAGTIALLRTRFPSLTARQLGEVLTRGGRATGGFEGQVKALDAEAAFAAVGALDTTPPSQVQGLQVQPVAPGEVTLSWSPASDNRGVASYRIRRDGQWLGASAALTFTDRGMAGLARYAVQAVDADGNEGPWSQEVFGQGGEASPLFQALKVERGADALTFSWRTTEALRCCVQWGTTAQLGQNSPWEAQASREHRITLTGLKRFTLHHHRLVGVDERQAMSYSETLKTRTKLWWLFQSPTEPAPGGRSPWGPFGTQTKPS